MEINPDVKLTDGMVEYATSLIDKLPRWIKVPAIIALTTLALNSIPHSSSAQGNEKVYLPLITKSSTESNQNAFNPTPLGVPDAYRAEYLADRNPNPTFRAATALIYSALNDQIISSCKASIVKDNTGTTRILSTGHCWQFNDHIGRIPEQLNGAITGLYVPGVGHTRIDAIRRNLDILYSPFDTVRRDGLAFYKLSPQQQAELQQADNSGIISILSLGSFTPTLPIFAPISAAGEYMRTEAIVDPNLLDSRYQIGYIRDTDNAGLVLCGGDSSTALMQNQRGLMTLVGIHQEAVLGIVYPPSISLPDPLAHTGATRTCESVGIGYQIFPTSSNPGPNSSNYGN